jgi:hypothetical protein
MRFVKISLALAMPRKPCRAVSSGRRFLAEEAPEETLAWLDRFLPRG